jgi:hypothetical protein
MEQVTLEKINENVELLKQMVLSIQENMEDNFLTSEEEELLEESLRDRKDGKLKTIDEIEKALDL